MRPESVEDHTSSDEDSLKNMSVEEVYRKYGSSGSGLSEAEAQKRIEQYGLNEIVEHKQSPILKFLHYFWGPIPWMIEAAVILSALIQKWEDFAIIMVLLLMNAFVGFFQERKADNAIETLKRRLALRARVCRDGKWRQIESRDLVPGDVIRLRLGDIVPADGKLFEGDYLLTDESALTGESLPVEKHVSDLTFSGSVVKQGEMNAVVVATGLNSFFGRTTKLVEEAKTISHFQKAVIKIGNFLILMAIALVAVVVVVALFRHESFLETIRFALVLTVAAIPAALPAVLSVTMAVGAIALAKKEAIVSKLVSIEELAGMDVLCSDKTGTITKNELTVAEYSILGDSSEHDLFLFASLASREEDQDPIDNAIIARASQIDGLREEKEKYVVSDFKPFDPVKKRTESSVKAPDGSRFIVAKGAPQIILGMAADKDTLSARCDHDLNSFASKGYRSLGVARTTGSGSWQFMGLIALHDPPRDDSGETIKTAQSMNVKVKMVTGDHVAIAREIAQTVNLRTDIVTAASIADLPDEEAGRLVEEADGFAQVYPEHKYRIVELLQRRGHIVGMTGDGVNDAPALRKADAGIAVAGATDAAKSAADIVLTRPGLSVIVDAMKESRKIFQRMKSYAIYRIAETIRVLFFIVASIIAFNFYPVSAIMIVLLAVFNDAPIMAIAYDNVRYSNSPNRWQMNEVLVLATYLGLIGVFFSFFIFYIGKSIMHLDSGTLQTFIFLKLAVAGHLTIFLSRTRNHFWTIRPSGALFWSAVGTKLLATLVAVYGVFIVSVGWTNAGIVWGYAAGAFVLTDLVKVQLYKVLDKRSSRRELSK